MKSLSISILLVTFSLLTGICADQPPATTSITNSTPIKSTETSDILSDISYRIRSITKNKITPFTQGN
jgi:hypothetical protein